MFTKRGVCSTVISVVSIIFVISIKIILEAALGGLQLIVLISQMCHLYGHFFYHLSKLLKSVLFGVVWLRCLILKKYRRGRQLILMCRREF